MDIRINKKSFIIIVVSSTILLYCFICSCGGAYRATPVHRPPLEETEQIIYKNWDLKHSVGVMDISEDRVNNLLKVRTKLKNLTGKTINAEIKIKFLDATGYEVGHPASWFPLPLESGEIRSYEQIASSKDAVDFRILIQRAGSH